MASRTAASKRSPPSAPEINWKIEPDVVASAVDGHPIRRVNFRFQRRGHRPLQFALTAEDAYELREEIGRAYDAVN